MTGVAHADADATFFRVFLTDGTVLVSYGEFARLDDRVIVSMPVGGASDRPRLHVVELPASFVDWPRTDRYTESARYHQYAASRGEADFRRLSDEVARVLSDIALSTDRQRALEIADRARRTLAEWPRSNFGYRENDVREIVALLDEAINALQGQAGVTSFELSLTATAPGFVPDPVLGLPTAREQLDQILRVAMVVDRASDRVALLQAARTLLMEARAEMVGLDVNALRRSLDAQLRHEAAVDARYAKLGERAVKAATRGAANARVADVQRVLEQIAREDTRLGHRRPDVVQALHAVVQTQLDAARQLRLLRDQWTVRRGLYRQYQRTVSAQLVQLGKTQPWLDAIRRLDGPNPDTLVSLRARLRGGADQLERLHVPADLRPVHELLVGSWRFAENAVNIRYEAAAAADVHTAWEASSAAAGALMLLSRMQQEISALLEPPTLP